jgi:surface antigen
MTPRSTSFTILFILLASTGIALSACKRGSAFEAAAESYNPYRQPKKPSFSHVPPKIGDPVDSLNGVVVYYNGPVGNVVGRYVAADNYNLGLKYQCVEFVKRYYYEYYRHKMPDSYGHAKDFFDPNVKDGGKNKSRDLTQYRNPSRSRPQVGDLLVFAGTGSNPYGHVAIVSRVYEDHLEIIQQNPGALGRSRANFALSRQGEAWKIEHGLMSGWLRKE